MVELELFFPEFAILAICCMIQSLLSYTNTIKVSSFKFTYMHKEQRARGGKTKNTCLQEKRYRSDQIRSRKDYLAEYKTILKMTSCSKIAATLTWDIALNFTVK